ncbi:GDSL-type esterase/lipase family protein [Angustibacter peucedani]
MTGRLLVLGDSLTYHGPSGPVLITDPRLWPQRVGSALGRDVDLLARQGWTARDAWWALTKDPVAWSVLLPRADVLVLAVGGMDALPASLPTYLREGIAYLRPAPLRRRARRWYRAAHPAVVRAVDGRWRTLPQTATDHYLSRVVTGARYYRPGLRVLALAPPPWRSQDHPSQRSHAPSVRAARAWAAREDVALVELDPVVGPALAAGGGNPDGLHWDWPTHAAVADAVLARLRADEHGTALT